ncbi:DUF1565 domain-containing protein [bacterium]|nr:DUF1565 domain-containing protein [bacterium]
MEEKCQAILSVWTEHRMPSEICREMGIQCAVLNQWQQRAMRGMAVFCDTGTSTVFGGTEKQQNEFINNSAELGKDFFASEIPVETINTRYNSFSGIPFSDYYVAPAEAFDVTGSLSEITPIQQSIYVSQHGNDDNDGISPSRPFRTINKALSSLHATKNNPITIYINEGLYSPDTRDEQFPLPLLSHVSLKGDQKQRADLDAESTGQSIGAVW